MRSSRSRAYATARDRLASKALPLLLLLAPRPVLAQRYAPVLHEPRAATVVVGVLPGGGVADGRATARRTVVGAVAGAVVGGALGAALAQGACERPRCDAWRRGLAAGAVVGAAAGAVIGAVIGRASFRAWP